MEERKGAVNIAVIDDSIDEARQLTGLISAHCSDTYTYQQTITFDTAADFPHCWQRGSLDLIFVDIFLRNEISSIRIAERVCRDDDFYTIMFTTSSTDSAPKGYEIRALDYMIKPIRYEKLCQTMEYFVSVSHREQSHYIEIKENRTILKIPIDSILCTDYSNHYIQIHLPNKTIRTYVRFEEFSGIPLIYSQFMCCYRNCIINMDKVFSMGKSEFILTTGEHLPITGTMRSQIHRQYANYRFSRLNGGI